MNSKRACYILNFRAILCFALPTIILSSCGTPTHLAYLDGKSDSVAFRSSAKSSISSSAPKIASLGSGTVYLEGFEPTSGSGDANWKVVSYSDYDHFVSTGKLTAKQQSQSSIAMESPLPKSSGEVSYSHSGSRSGLPPTPSYAGASIADLDCEDDLKTMRQAKLVWTVGGAVKGAFWGALLEGGMAALRGGGRDAVKNAAIHGGVTGGAVGAAEGSRTGGIKGAETVAMKKQARHTEAELMEKINQAQTFNMSVATVNAKLRQKLSMVSDKKVRKSILSVASSSLGQIDYQIKVMEDFVGDETSDSMHSEMLAKLQTLKNLRSAIAETEQTAKSARV